MVASLSTRSLTSSLCLPPGTAVPPLTSPLFTAVSQSEHSCYLFLLCKGPSLKRHPHRSWMDGMFTEAEPGPVSAVSQLVIPYRRRCHLIMAHTMGINHVRLRIRHTLTAAAPGWRWTLRRFIRGKPTQTKQTTRQTGPPKNSSRHGGIRQRWQTKVAGGATAGVR